MGYDKRTKEQLIREIKALKKQVTGLTRIHSSNSKAEKELYAYQEKLRDMVSEMSMVKERERRRVAMDLHDSIGQFLAISRLKLGLLEGDPALTGFVNTMGEIRGLLDKAIDSTRSLIFELSPPVLQSMSLEEAVKQLAEEFKKQYGISIDFQYYEPLKPVEEEIRVFLFKAVRELLINIIKHAHAHNVRLSLQKVKDKVVIIVKDDGIGFDSSYADFNRNSRGGFGLFNIREQARCFGGRFELESESGQGTRATLVVSLGSKKDLKNKK